MSKDGGVGHKHFDIDKEMKRFLNLESPIKKRRYQDKRMQCSPIDTGEQADSLMQELKIEEERRKYKDHVLLGKEFKTNEQRKAVTQTKNFYGVGRYGDYNSDAFVVTRILNNPQLIFNQRPQLDKDKRFQFF